MNRIFLILFPFLFICNHGYTQSKLEKAKKSLKVNNQPIPDDDSYILLDAFGFISSLFPDGSSNDTDYVSHKKVTKYPYFKSTKPGNYVYFAPDSITKNYRVEILNKFIVENPKLYGNHLNIGVRSADGFGLEIDYLQLWENNTNFGYNSLAITTGLLKYYWIHEERFDTWIGLGANFLEDNISDWGLSAGIGAEYFFIHPMSLEVNLYWSFNGGTIQSYSTGLNYHYKRYIFSGGYEFLKIGDPDFSMFSVGVGVSF